MGRIFVTKRVPDLAFSLLAAAGHEVVLNPKGRTLSKRELVRALRSGDYDAALTLLTDTIDADVMDANPRVKLYANYAVGFNNIDLEAAKARGITVTNTPGGVGDTVAEHTVALLLALATRTLEGDRFVRARKYRGWEPLLLLGTQLGGKTLGLIGAGHIGERVAHALTQGFGMKAIYYDIRRNNTFEEKYGARFCSTPEEVLREADAVSLHVPLTKETHHLINEERIALMKPGSFLINTARGPVVDEEALARALLNKKIAGAALDVFEREPKVNSKLLKLPNVILTPHIASATVEARDHMARVAAENIIAFLRGEKPPCAVM